MEKMDINNVIRISTSLDSTFFEYWLAFLRPLHSCTDGQIKVLASFLKKRMELGKQVQGEYLDKMLMSVDVRRQVREEVGIGISHFNIIMHQLREKGIIVNDKINPKLIPHIKEGNKGFKLLLLFDMQ